MSKVSFHKEALKHINKFPFQYKNRVAKAISTLEQNPHKNNLNITKLIDYPGKFFRIRLGDIRIIYELDETNDLIIIHDINFRGNVY